MKKLNLKLSDFYKLNNVVIYNAAGLQPISKISIDSRDVPVGALFIAIEGDKFNGHDFVLEAIKKGAAAVLISKKHYKKFKDLDAPIIIVKDTTLALGELASIWRNKLNTKIVAITGSAGKTTTKELLFALLAGKYKVNKTLGNHNNHIGVPLTIFSTNIKHDFLVLELGTNHFGEIKYSAQIAKPDYAIITNIGNSHLEFLKNPKGVFKEKSALFKLTKANNGFIIINNDDKYLSSSNKKYSKKITYGFNKKSDVRGKIIEFSKDGKPFIRIDYKGQSSTFQLPIYGAQSAKNFLAAAAVCYKIGLRSADIRRQLIKIKAFDKRLHIQKHKNFILINDTYNANPESTRLSLELLSQIKTYEKKIAILGDMFELGKQSKLLHEKLSSCIIESGINSIYTIGKMMKHLHNKIKISGKEVKHFENRESLQKFLKNKSFTNSIVLVKGSRGMRMEDFVESINPIGV